MYLSLQGKAFQLKGFRFFGLDLSGIVEAHLSSIETKKDFGLWHLGEGSLKSAGFGC